MRVKHHTSHQAPFIACHRDKLVNCIVSVALFGLFAAFTSCKQETLTEYNYIDVPGTTDTINMNTTDTINIHTTDTINILEPTRDTFLYFYRNDWSQIEYKNIRNCLQYVDYVYMVVGDNGDYTDLAGLGPAEVDWKVGTLVQCTGIDRHRIALRGNWYIPPNSISSNDSLYLLGYGLRTNPVAGDKNAIITNNSEQVINHNKNQHQR